jgi:hypothetical protein
MNNTAPNYWQHWKHQQPTTLTTELAEDRQQLNWQRTDAKNNEKKLPYRRFKTNNGSQSLKFNSSFNCQQTSETLPLTLP